MTTRNRKRVVATLLMTSALALLILWPTKVRPGRADEVVSPPETIELTGILRDFRKDHPDFNIIPEGGAGHYAGNTQLWLPGSRRPSFVGGGFKVEQEWENKDGRPIAPHLAFVQGGSVPQGDRLGLRVDSEIRVDKESVIDAFNSNYGPYGLDGNYGGFAIVTTNSTKRKTIRVERQAVIRGDVLVGPGGNPSEVIESKGIITGARQAMEEAYPMPAVSLPEDLDSYNEHEDIEGVVTLTGDTNPDDDSDVPALHFGKLHIKKDSIVTIEGDLRIVCDDELKIERSEIILLPDASLTFFVNDGDVAIKDKALVNVANGVTTDVSINVIGAGKIKIEGDSHVYATIIAPQCELEVKKAHFYGAYVGRDLHVHEKVSGVHVDLANSVLGPWNFAITVREKIEIDDDSFVDSFDSNEGPYGGANIGADAMLTTNETKDHKVKVKHSSVVHGSVLVGPGGNPNKVIEVESNSSITGSRGVLPLPSPIPVVAPPPLGSSVGDIEYDGGVHVLSGEIRCKKLKLEHGAIVKIQGDTIIRCDDKLEMKDGSEIQLLPNATLIAYINKELKLDEDCLFNMNTGNPQRVSIRRTSVSKKGKVEIKKRSALCAWVQGAKTEMKIEEESQFFGSFAGRKIKVKKDSKLHVDMAGLTQCLVVADTGGEAGAEGSGGITSPETFSKWYRDDMGTNLSKAHAITMTRIPGGVYEYLNDDFYPIDDELFGNEGDAHNHHFTYGIAAEFIYRDYAGQFVEFEGGDGALIFIDSRLVIDLGGVGAAGEQYFNLDRFGLKDGETYRFDLFFAQRRPGSSVFRLRTDLELSSRRMIPSVTGGYD